MPFLFKDSRRGICDKICLLNDIFNKNSKRECEEKTHKLKLWQFFMTFTSRQYIPTSYVLLKDLGETMSCHWS